MQVLDGASPANTDPVRVDKVPGTGFRYSGGGTSIVQLMLVDQLKKPFPEIMQQTVLGPLGLRHSSYEQPLPPARAALTATGHRSTGKAIAGRWHIYPEMAAAGLWTTPSDLAQVAIEVAKSKFGKSNKILSEAMTRQMLTVQAAPVGLGFFVDPKTDEFSHDGADEGFQASLTAFADSGDGVAIMVNSDNGMMLFERLTAAVAKEYGWKNFSPRPEPVFVTLVQVARFRGVETALAQYNKMRAGGPAERFNPAVLNALGYYVLRGGNAGDAVKIFTANVALYPSDANAYDSLGEAYMNAGEKDRAIANYRKSLELNSRNDNAVKMLKQLGVEWTPEKKPEK